MKRYLVAWTGGYEEPGFYATNDLDDANAKYDEWYTTLKKAQNEEGEFQGDWLHLLDLADDTPKALRSL